MMGIFLSFLLHWSSGCIFSFCATNHSLFLSWLDFINMKNKNVEPFQSVGLQQKYEGLNFCQSFNHGH